MRYRKFGRTGWNVSEIGYGMWGLAGWTGSDDAESLDALQRAVDLGCNFFDTAWAYGAGRSEQILGKVLRANKNNSAVGGPDKKLYVATKIPPKNEKWPSRRDFTLDDCYPPNHIEEYVNKSLANLGVEKLDLIQFHTWEDRWLTASIAGNRTTAFAPCSKASPMPSRSSTTFSTRIPRTLFSPLAA